MRKSFWPERVYVAEDAAEDALVLRMLARLGDVEVVRVAEDADPNSATARSGTELEAFNRGKRELVLKRYKGSWLRSCPGTSQHVCCNLWTVNPGEGCPLDCTYCYLQSYLRRNPTLKLYTNTAAMLAEIEQRASAQPNRLFRIGTGEVIDSLVWDDLSDATLELVPFFARVPNIVLELKTKTATIDNLLALRDEHKEKTVVSWSVNAPSITATDEAYTASLDERIAAAKKVVEAGYRVGFHFDPMIMFSGWEDEYRDTVTRIFSEVPATAVAWVSISTLRYRPEMQDIMTKRFPESAIPYGEQFLAKDNKIRYIQPLRFKLERFLWDELKAVREDMPVYMCMESSTAWKTIAGASPTAGDELVEIFSRRGRLPIVQQSDCSV